MLRGAITVCSMNSRSKMLVVESRASLAKPRKIISCRPMWASPI
jgi:hypothetical protein